MAFAVGKRVVAESESTNRRPRCGVVAQVLRARQVLPPDPRGPTAVAGSHTRAHGGALRVRSRGKGLVPPRVMEASRLLEQFNGAYPPSRARPRLSAS
jgi:hypothetical protein